MNQRENIKVDWNGMEMWEGTILKWWMAWGRASVVWMQMDESYDGVDERRLLMDEFQGCWLWVKVLILRGLKGVEM